MQNIKSKIQGTGNCTEIFKIHCSGSIENGAALFQATGIMSFARSFLRIFFYLCWKRKWIGNKFCGTELYDPDQQCFTRKLWSKVEPQNKNKIKVLPYNSIIEFSAWLIRIQVKRKSKTRTNISKNIYCGRYRTYNFSPNTKLVSPQNI